MTRPASRPTRSAFTLLELLVVVAVLILILSICGGLDISPLVLLFTGWFTYLTTNLRFVQFDWPRLFSALVWVTLFVLGLHLFCSWFYSSVGTAPQSAPRRWKFRWTATASAIVLLTFAAGISLVATVHTIGFMVSANESIYAYVNRAAQINDWQATARWALELGRRQGLSAQQVLGYEAERATFDPTWDFREVAHYAAVDGPDGVVAAVLICHRDPAKQAEYGIAVATPDGTHLERDTTPAQVLQALLQRAAQFPTTQQSPAK